MSSSITQCPECATRFKVSEAQLAVHQGMVRCGRCTAVFDATQHFTDLEASPQLDLPIAVSENSESIKKAVEPEINLDSSPEAGASAAADRFATETNDPVHFLDEISPLDPPEIIRPESADGLGTLPENSPEDSLTLAQKIIIQDDVAEPIGSIIKAPLKKRRQWPWVIVAILLMAGLSLQGIFFYRVEIAAQLPGLKPQLQQYCAVLHCSIALPQKPDLISIESSDLEADPVQANIVTLNAILRNMAHHVQAYPTVQLSLTDLEDKVIARRNFTPADYLKTGEDEKLGLSANREISVKLSLDTLELKPAGYKLFVFYPQL
ncbi:MAG: DUF3426 domain-containing protein [Gallionellaceae bacterium]|jgi:predicted Zn finger-like uncharacterized protein